MRSSLARWKIVTAVAATVLVAACGSAAPNGASTPSPTTAATGSPQSGSAICSDAAALRASLERIVSFQPGKDALAGLRADLADANAKLAALRANPNDPWSPQLTALDTTLTKLRAVATNPAVNARPAGVARVLGDVQPKVRTFIAAAKAQCPEL